MRALVRSAIIGDSELIALGVVASGVVAGDVDAPTERPLLVLRWGTTTPGLSTLNTRQLTIWVHDVPNDYTRIDAIVKRLRVVLDRLIGVQHSYGWITGVEWTGDSDDLSDPDGHRTILRQTNFTIVGSGS
jgi:hypothetical protein